MKGLQKLFSGLPENQARELELRHLKLFVYLLATGCEILIQGVYLTPPAHTALCGGGEYSYLPFSLPRIPRVWTTCSACSLS